LWVAAGVGLAAGLGFYVGAIAAAIATVVMLAIERPLLRWLRPKELVTVSAVVTSDLSLGDFMGVIQHAGVEARRINRTSRSDGGAEIVATGIKRAASVTVIRELESRPDVVEVSCLPE